MSLYHRIMCKFSEPYRIECGFGLSPIRNKREFNALIKFCKRQLEDTELMELSPKYKTVYETTVRLYTEQILNDDWSSFKKGYKYHIDEYIRNHLDWYWD